MPSTGNSKTGRRRVGVISIHPAPYRDPTFALIHQRGGVDLDVLSIFPESEAHPNWDLGRSSFGQRPILIEGQTASALAFARSTVRRLKEGDYDVVVIPGWGHPVTRTALAYCFATRIPFVYSADTVLFHSANSSPGVASPRALSRFVERAILSRAGAMWIPGRACAAYMRARQVPNERLFEGCYCLDVETIQASHRAAVARRQELRARLGIDDEAFVFLFVGGLQRRRGIDTLLSAQAILEAKGCTSFSVLVGAGDQRERLVQSAIRQRVKRVRFVEPVPFAELPAYYAAADGYVHPGHEPYSLALAQAAIGGLPIVASDHVGATLDYVVNGESGLLVREGYLHELVTALDFLAAHREAGKKMGSAARNVAARRNLMWAAAQFEKAVSVALGGEGSPETSAGFPRSRPH
jgi:glycosyltransferase involved in cell wall biosynthesis